MQCLRDAEGAPAPGERTKGRHEGRAAEREGGAARKCTALFHLLAILYMLPFHSDLMR